MADVSPFPSGAAEAKHAREAAAARLLEQLWTEFKAAASLYKDEQTKKHWQELVRVRTCWEVGYRCEYGDSPK